MPQPFLKEEGRKGVSCVRGFHIPKPTHDVGEPATILLHKLAIYIGHRRETEIQSKFH